MTKFVFKFLITVLTFGVLLLTHSLLEFDRLSYEDDPYNSRDTIMDGSTDADDTEPTKQTTHIFSRRIFGGSSALTKDETLMRKTALNTRSESNVQQTQKRLNVLRDTCANIHLRYNGTLADYSVMRHFLYDKKSKILFCDLPKIGSTFLKQVLHIVVGHRDNPNPFNITGDEAHEIEFSRLNELQFTDMIQTVQESFKFLFVRNPYSRILSGYVDKFFTNNLVFWDTTGHRIVRNYRYNASEISLRCGHNVQFEEFIKYIIYSERNNVHRDPHWCPVFESCRPCKMKFDFIGKIENYQEDIKSLLIALKKDDMVNLTTMNEGNDWEAITLTVFRAYQTALEKPECITLPGALERAWKVLQLRSVITYRTDFPYKFIAKHSNITQVQFLKLIKRNIEQHPLSKVIKAQIRKEAIFKAFTSLSGKTLNEFRNIFLPDFLYFEYDVDRPESVLGKSAEKWDPFTLKLSETN